MMPQVYLIMCPLSSIRVPFHKCRETGAVWANCRFWRFDSQISAIYDLGMVAMAEIEPGKYLTVAEAVDFMGCSQAWVRTLLGRGELRGARRIGQRVWLIPESAAREARDGLTTRSKSKRHLAKRPAAKRAKPKKAASRRK